VQALADVHDTPKNLVIMEPAGLGVVSTLQLLPFQASANVREVPLALE
jgi:hypothetical protein